jgi:YfiH family protein
MPVRNTSPKKSWNRQRIVAPAARPICAPWKLHKFAGLHVLELAPFAKFPWLVHGFSTRHGGVSALDGQRLLNLSFMEWDAKENVLENRKRLQSAVGAKDLTLVVMKQIHSDVVHRFTAMPAQASKGDASFTNKQGLLLGTQTADCVPILLVDPKRRVVAAAHAGWKGTLARIAQKTVGRMQMDFGCQPAEMFAATGPCIGPCCYEVGAEFVTKFAAQFADADEYFDEARTGDEPNPLQWLNMKPPGHQPPPKNVHLDLRKANRLQLVAAGLRPKNIYTSDLCTGCRTDLFFSYRREGAQSGRMLSVIGIRKP